MKTDIDKIILEESERASHLEELLLELEKPEIAAELQELADGTENSEDVELDQIVRNSKVLLDIIADQAKARLVWQIVAACFLALVVITSFVGLGLYMSRQNQVEKLNLAEANVRRISNDFTQADQKIKTLENQLADSKTELKNAQKQLESSDTDIKNLQNQLADTTQRLKALQNNNAEVRKQLSERLQKLSASRKN